MPPAEPRPVPAPHRVSVESGKYTFVQRTDGVVSILRHGQPWAHDVTACNAIGAMMAELDAARVVLAAAVACAQAGDAPPGLVAAIDLHERLVDDTNGPSPWTTLE